jgi:hypothetical protein
MTTNVSIYLVIIIFQKLAAQERNDRSIPRAKLAINDEGEWCDYLVIRTL